MHPLVYRLEILVQNERSAQRGMITMHPLAYRLEIFSVAVSTFGGLAVRSRYTLCSEYIRVYLECRVPFVLRALLIEYCGTGGLNAASTGSMSSTEGPDTASAGSMSSSEPRVRAVPAVQTSGILAVLKSIRSIEPRKNGEFSQYELPKYCQCSYVLEVPTHPPLK